MNPSRRNFFKRLGLAAITSMGLPKLASSVEPFQDTILSDKKNGLTILFQGDSITDGNRTRNNDWNHIMGHGYAYLIASRLWYEYPDGNLMFYNRGISGDRVRDLDARWQKDCLDLKPDVVSILIGVNDVLAVINNDYPDSIDKFEEYYTGIISATLEKLPEVKIVLCEPFMLPGARNNETGIWRSEILERQRITRKLSDTYRTYFVELQKPFDEACLRAPADYWIWDGVHPMPAGHELIARCWIKEAQKFLTIIH